MTSRTVRPLSRPARLLSVGILLLGGVIALNRDMAYLSTVPAADVPNFKCYALGFWEGAAQVQRGQASACATVWHGHSPRRLQTLPTEYPPLALAVFTLPLLVPWLSYSDAYIWWMALLVLLATGLLAWLRSPRAAVAFLVYTLLSGWTFALERYDLVPALCVLLALAVAQRGRLRTATTLLAVGTLLKWFPLALFPLVVVEQRRTSAGRSWDLLAIMAAVLGAGVMLTFVFDPMALLTPFSFQIARPPQIESTPATLLWLAGVLSGLPVHPVLSYNSLNLVGPTAGLWSTLCTLAWLVLIAVACVRLWRGHDTLGRGFLLVLLVTLATAKVFSTQYILWLLPVTAHVEGLRARWVIVSMLTLLIAYTYTLGAVTPLMLYAILTRNTVLWGLILWYLARDGALRRQS